MAAVTAEPTTKPRISSGCKTFTLPKPPVASQTTQKTQAVLKATPTFPKLCLRTKTTGLTARLGRFNTSEKDTLVTIQSTDTQNIYTKCEFLSHKHS